MRGQEGISGSSGDLFVLGGADGDGVRHDGDEAVNVSAHVDFGQIAVLEDHVGIAVERRVVANAVVDRDAAGKGDALADLLVLLEGLAGLFLEAGVRLLADVADGLAGLAHVGGLLQHP